MFEYVHSPEPRAPFGDWLLRGGIAFVFVTAGIDKYSPDWVRLFQEIGLGQWFRHFTGVVEILGGIGVVVPSATGILPMLSVLAAIGLVIVMIGAVGTHIRLKELDKVPGPIVLIALCVFVAYGRQFLAPI